MKKKRFFCYRHTMGNMWTVLGKQLPECVCEVIREAWLVYSVDEFAAIPEFELFRAKWRGIQFIVQLVAGSMYSVKIWY